MLSKFGPSFLPLTFIMKIMLKNKLYLISIDFSIDYLEAVVLELKNDVLESMFHLFHRRFHKCYNYNFGNKSTMLINAIIYGYDAWMKKLGHHTVCKFFPCQFSKSVIANSPLCVLSYNIHYLPRQRSRL